MKLGRLVRAGAILAGAGSLAILVIAWPRAVLVAPPPTALLLDRNGNYLAETASSPDAPLGFWPASPVPERVAAAMIAIEDRNFEAHPGVDPGAIARALLQNIRAGRRVSGASTIAMQVARMQNPGPRKISRKIVEAATAVLLVARHGRPAVLAHYLTIAPYGNHLHGIVYAARRYLNKPAIDLSWAEIAFLAAIPQSPSRMNPYDYEGRKRAIARGRHILELLFQRGVIAPAELELAQAQLAELSIPREPVRPPEALHFVMRVQESSGTMVHTSLDLPLQSELAELAALHVERWSKRGAENAAAIVVDRSSAEVLAYLGSADYFDQRHAGAIDFANVPRASGSTLKPFIYAHALDRGVLTPSTIVDDLRRAVGATENADRDFLGPLLPRVALGNSRNVPAVNLMHALGAPRTYELFAELGLHRRRVPYEWYGSGIAIGLLPVTLTDLTRAYTALAGDGRLRELVWVRSFAEPAAGPRIFSEDTARQLTLFLSDPLARLPTFPRMGSTEYPFPVALKTGTSEAYRDAWTVAYSRKYLVAAWVGRADAKPMTMVGGSSAAAHLVRAIFARVHREELAGFDDLAFPPPEDHVAVAVCDKTGLRANDACEHTFLEWFPRGDQPIEKCDAHLGGFTKLDPRYASWAAGRGLVAPPPALDATAPAAAAPDLVEPRDGIKVQRDPETPPERSTLALEAIADAAVTQLVFYVDGKPFQVVKRPFKIRWPLQDGDHTFEARLPYGDARSKRVRVRVE